MRFTISQPTLLRSLSTVSRGMASNPDNPMLGGVLVVASDGMVEMQATDSNVSVRHVAPAAVEEEGATVLSGKLLANMAKGMPDEAVTFETRGPRVSVECARSRTLLNPLDPALFPRFPEVTPTSGARLPADVLSEMVSRVHRMTSRDNSRPTLSGVLLRVGDGSLTVAATDTYRIGVCTAPCDGGPFEAIVPGQRLNDALRDAAGEVVVGMSESQVSVACGQSTTVMRRVEGTFPNYGAVIPASFGTTVTLDAGELADAVRRVALVADANPAVTMRVSGELPVEVTLMATSQERGEASESVPADTEGVDVTVHMNHRYLLDGIGHMSGGVRCGIAGPLSPLAFESDDGIDFTFLLMPIRG